MTVEGVPQSIGRANALALIAGLFTKKEHLWAFIYQTEHVYRRAVFL
jgi:hypothetical protein